MNKYKGILNFKVESNNRSVAQPRSIPDNVLIFANAEPNFKLESFFCVCIMKIFFAQNFWKSKIKNISG